jgi:ABC transport system ATP-binding/permease protein
VLAFDGHGGVTLVRGGYAGWRADHDARRARAGDQPPDQGSRPVAPARPERSRAARSPSTLRRLLAEAEREVARLTGERDAVRADLAAAGDDHERLAALGHELAALEATLTTAEERWLELAAEAEATGLTV